jgi:pyridinium-3,5-biscarboxylic acid mononucleotide synthase
MVKHAPLQGQDYSPAALRRLLTHVKSGEVPVEAALESLRNFPFECTASAMVDHHRTLRKGFAEVIYCAGKTPAQVADIAARLGRNSRQLLGTRATVEHYRAAKKRLRKIRYDPQARVLWMDESDPQAPKHEGIVIIAAGTSDLPVAREAEITARVMGHEPVFIHDVGVAGLHRLLHHLPALQRARVVVAVAGMEGALPSVVAGLVAAPVIAVPTSVGYGAAFGGVTALLAMLNSCASGLAVVNIDNGFGAAYLAVMINNQCVRTINAER